MRTTETYLLSAILVCALCSQAALIHSGPKNITLDGNIVPTPLDLDEDGLEDLHFSYSTGYSTDEPTSTGYGWFLVNPLSNHAWVDGFYSPPNPNHGLDPEISAPLGTWSNAWVSVGQYYVLLLEDAWSGWIGPWFDTDVAYLTLLFRDMSNRLRQAWIRILLPDDRTYPIPITIMDWYYEDAPLDEPTAVDVDIDAGQDQAVFSFWSIHKGLRYVLERSTNLEANVWTSNITVRAGSSINPLVLTNSIPAPPAFWRLRRLN
jgi:hypothetical protein